jgi:5'-3' exonuclease
MGIPYYFYTLYKRYANAKLMIDICEIKAVDHLFFDYNSMIHPCAQKVLGNLTDSDLVSTDIIEERIIQECIGYTRYVLSVLKPNNVYIMIDGVAPRAKMNQQRERRYKSTFFKEIYQKTSTFWDTNKITPGTKFMKKIQLALDILAVEYRDLHLVDRFIISDSDECGEGEHKMMKAISKFCETGSIVIYALDADLIMLGMMSKRSDSIVLLRDNKFNEKLEEAQRTFTYLDISVLKKCICQEVCNGLETSLKFDTNRIVQDYIFICFLLGNDFLEHLPSLTIKENGVGVLTKIYIRMLAQNNAQYLINDVNDSTLENRINLRFLRDLLHSLSRTEDYFFKNVYKNSCVYKDISILECYTNLTFYKEDCIMFYMPGYKTRYYSYYGVSDANRVCKDYLSGLYWILGYYNNHEHNNWDWYYAHHATPFVSDLFTYIDTLIKNKDETPVIIPTSNCSPIEQLFMVLPRMSLIGILKEGDKEFYEKVERVFRTASSKELDLYYPRKINVDMIHKEYLWQSKIFFTHFNKQFLSIFI